MLALVFGAVAVGCGDGSDSSAVETRPISAATDRCLVRLHGKGGEGAETVVEDDVSVIAPDGNAEGWDARQWLYFPDGEYTAARNVVEDAVAGCREVIINGFSNGAAFAAKLYCRGETLGDRVVRVVVDDPVVDAGVEDCSPDPSVAVTLYWTGALEAQAQPGWDCSEADWTCEGGRTIGIDAYAEALRTEPQASPFEDHQWFVEAPELSAWR
ncbi:MAG: hypothetical protein EHM63_07575 [Actinobacteria bacterium]|nr:MAG: hypothetical protein EHM63_07575 [Actinomycetota bacterium]